MDHPLQPFSPLYFVEAAASTRRDEGEGDDFAAAPGAELDDGDDFSDGDDFGDDFASDNLGAAPSPAPAHAAGAAGMSQGVQGVQGSAATQLGFDPAQLPPVYTFASEWAPAPAVPPDWVAPGATQAPLPAPTPQGEVLRVDLGQLARFLRKPVEAFYAQRLQVQAADAAEAVPDDEAFALDPLAQWSLQNALMSPLQHAVNALGQPGGQPLEATAPEELLHSLLGEQRLAGQLPLHGFGDVAQEGLHKTLQRLMARYTRVAEAWPEPLAEGALLHWRTPDGRALVQASLQGLRRAPDGSLAQVQLIASRLHRGQGLKHHLLLAPWVQHLAWHIALGEGGHSLGQHAAAQGLHTLVVSESGVWRLAPLAPADARSAWSELLAAWQAGLCAPLPLTVGAGSAWLAKRKASIESGQGEPRARLTAQDLPSRDALSAARSAFEGGFMHSGDLDQSAATRRAYPQFDDLLREPDAFGDWAKRLYLPVLNGGHAWQPQRAGAPTPDLRLPAAARLAQGQSGLDGRDGDDDADWGSDDFDAPDDGDARL